MWRLNNKLRNLGILAFWHLICAFLLYIAVGIFNNILKSLFYYKPITIDYTSIQAQKPLITNFFNKEVL